MYIRPGLKKKRVMLKISLKKSVISIINPQEIVFILLLDLKD